MRDALSLLDRALISINEETLKLNYVQKIFGYVDKSSYIDLLEYIFKGDEKTVLDHYRNLYNSGIEPDTFLNDFLEILYYIKNISYIQLQGKNFSLNDNDFKQILSLSKNLDSRDILLFWEYTLKTIKEIKLVSNPNLSIEMFLIQLMYIIKIYTKNKDETFNRKSSESHQNLELKNLKNNEPISQIKNIQQEEEKNKKINKETLNNLYDLIQLCADKKDIKLKYE